jgi:hypothetical protein
VCETDDAYTSFRHQVVSADTSRVGLTKRKRTQHCAPFVTFYVVHTSVGLCYLLSLRTKGERKEEKKVHRADYRGMNHHVQKMRGAAVTKLAESLEELA